MRTYTITRISGLTCSCLGGQGRVLGVIEVGEHRHPAEWTDGQTRIIESLPKDSWPLRENGKGDILLTRKEGDGFRSLFHRNGETIDAGRFAAVDMNDSGQVIGVSGDPFLSFAGWLWENGRTVQLPNDFLPKAINNHGVILGQQGKGHDALPALCRQGNVSILEIADRRLANADDINDSGQILASTNMCNAFIWQDGRCIDVELPYGGEYIRGYINNRGDVAAEYMVNIGQPYSFEEATFVWCDGVSQDLYAVAGKKTSYTTIHDIDDDGRILASDVGSDYALFTPEDQKDSGPAPRPDVQPLYVVQRDREKFRSLKWLGVPGSAKVERFFSAQLQSGEMQRAIDPHRIRQSAREDDAVLIIDKFGVTVPTYGFIPWMWLQSIEAHDVEGKPALVITWEITEQLRARFSDLKARMMLFEDGLAGGQMGHGSLQNLPLEELYRSIADYAIHHVPSRARPSKD